MQLSKPLLNVNWAGFFLRVPLGLYLFIAGWRKFNDGAVFVELVKSMNIVPEQLAVLYGVLLPYAEMFSGALLFFGFFVSFASIISSLILVSVIYALGFNPEGSVIFNKDILILSSSLALLATGGGALSIDEFRSGGSK